jgi:hypothetical protein
VGSRPKDDLAVGVIRCSNDGYNGAIMGVEGRILYPLKIKGGSGV